MVQKLLIVKEIELDGRVVVLVQVVQIILANTGGLREILREVGKADFPGAVGCGGRARDLVGLG